VIDSSASVLQAIEMMEKEHVRHLPVLGDDGHLTGVLSLKDIIHYLVEYFPQAVYNLPPTPTVSQPAREGA
jgi:CBS domain-containing protein